MPMPPAMSKVCGALVCEGSGNSKWLNGACVLMWSPTPKRHMKAEPPRLGATRLTAMR